MKGAVLTTMVNGNLVWHDGQIKEDVKGERLKFIR
jgi:hypothetical protein